MTSAHASHAGLVRKNNEDCIRTDDIRGIYLLADGIGGHNAGEVASALAVETVHGILSSNIAQTAADSYFELILYAINAAHWEISTKALTNSSYAHMGTTLVVAVVRENRVYIVHAGDSRCYLFQNRSCSHTDSSVMPERVSENESNNFRQLTHDHTLGEQLLSKGIPIEQISKKQFNTLTQSVGCGDPPSPEFNTVELKQGDLLLICSDGLTDMLTAAEIEAILANRAASLDALAVNLVEAANAHGGRDNISVILLTQ